MNNYEELDLDLKVDSDSKSEAFDSEDSVIKSQLPCPSTSGMSICYC